MKIRLEKTSRMSGKELLRGSFIASAVATLASFLSRLVENSLVARFFNGSAKTDRLYETSLFGALLNKLSFFKSHSRRFKLSFARACENSMILSRLQAFRLQSLAAPLRVYGEGLFCFGLLTVAMRFAKSTLFTDLALLSLDSLVGAAVFLVSLFMLPAKASVAFYLSESKLASFFLFNLLSFDRRKMAEIGAEKSPHAFAILLGLVCGAATFFVSPVLILAAFAGIAAVSVLLSNPEAGVISLFFLVPFLPTMALSGLVCVCFLAYLLKLLRGKRVLKIELLDLLLLLFISLLFFGGAVSVAGRASLPPSLVYILFLSSYFLVKNLISSVDLAKKCTSLLFVSGFLVAAYGIYQNFFGRRDDTWIDSDLFSTIESRVTSTLENPNVLGEYLILLLPIFLAFFFLSKGFKQKLFPLAAFAAAGLCLIYTWSRGAWLGFLVSLLFLLLLYSQKAMIAVAAGIFSVPFLPLALPETIIQRFTSIGNLSDSSSSYRLSIWESSVAMIRDFLLGGIGVGEGAFAGVYPNYSYAGVETAPHSHGLFLQLTIEMGIFALIFFVIILIVFAQKCLSFIADKSGTDRSMNALCMGGFCGTVAFGVQGFTDYTWYNYRVFLMFWLIFGLCVASIQNSKNEYVPVGAHIAVRPEGLPGYWQAPQSNTRQKGPSI